MRAGAAEVEQLNSHLTLALDAAKIELCINEIEAMLSEGKTIVQVTHGVGRNGLLHSASAALGTVYSWAPNKQLMAACAGGVAPDAS